MRPEDSLVSGSVKKVSGTPPTSIIASCATRCGFVDLTDSEFDSHNTFEDVYREVRFQDRIAALIIAQHTTSRMRLQAAISAVVRWFQGRLGFMFAGLALFNVLLLLNTTTNVSMDTYRSVSA